MVNELGLMTEACLHTSRGMDTLSGEVIPSKLFCFPCEKGSTLKGKNLLPPGANSFLLE